MSLLLPIFAAYADADSSLQKGDQLLTHNHVREAISCFDQAISENPRLDYAYCLRGEAYLRLEKYTLAMNDINQAISLNSKKWLYYETRARAKFETHDLDGAIVDATKALQLNPQSDWIYRLRSKLYIMKKDDKNALADLNQAIKVQKDVSDSNYKARADVYFRLNKYDLSVKDYTSAIAAIRSTHKDDRTLEKNYSGRANAYEKLGKKDLAAADRKMVQSFVKDGWGAFLYDEKK